MKWINIIMESAMVIANKASVQRQFIGLMGVLFLLGSYYFNWHFSMMEYAIIAGVFGVLFIKPVLIRPILFCWMLLGAFMGELSSFIVLSILYFLIFTPISWFKKREINEGNWKPIKRQQNLENMF